MSEAELIQLNKDHNCTLYTIQFITEDKGEYLRFYNRFKDDATYNKDLARIAKFVESIADLGALERFFRPEGKMNVEYVRSRSLNQSYACIACDSQTAFLFSATVESRKRAPMMKMMSCAGLWSPCKTLINLSKKV